MAPPLRAFLERAVILLTVSVPWGDGDIAISLLFTPGLGPLRHPCLCCGNHWPADTPHPLGLKDVLSECSRNYYPGSAVGRINHWQESPPRCTAVATDILCFQITHKFVLSPSHWPLPDSLNDVVYKPQLSFPQKTVWLTHTSFFFFFVLVLSHVKREFYKY